jgi:hypothetical protein
VVAVGGTTLPSSGGTAQAAQQTAWGHGSWSWLFGGSGGGISTYESQPSYQSGVVTQSTTQRTSPDVSYDANPNTGFSVYDSVPYYPYYPYSSYGSQSGWFDVGGTSAGAPQWSAFIALVDQGRPASAGNLGSTAALAALYSSTGRSDLQDITRGSNGYRAGPSYDLVTGLGTLQASHIVALAQYLEAAPATAQAASSSVTSSQLPVPTRRERPPAAPADSTTASASTPSLTPASSVLPVAVSSSRVTATDQATGRTTATPTTSFILPNSMGGTATAAEPTVPQAENIPLALVLGGPSAFSTAVTGILPPAAATSAPPVDAQGNNLGADGVPGPSRGPTPGFSDESGGGSGWILTSPAQVPAAGASCPAAASMTAGFADPAGVMSVSPAEDGAAAWHTEGTTSVRSWALAVMAIAAIQGDYRAPDTAEAEDDYHRKLLCDRD